MESNNIRVRLKNYNNFEDNIKPSIPKNALIELSNLCNHECIFCANSKMTRKKGEINKNFLYNILKEMFDLVLESEKYKKNKAPCSLPFNSIHVTYEGYLTACCIDFQNYLVVADLNRQKLKDAWLNEEFIELRQKHLEDKLDGTLCYNCLYNMEKNIKPVIPELATGFSYENYTKKDDILKKLDVLRKEG